MEPEAGLCHVSEKEEDCFSPLLQPRWAVGGEGEGQTVCLQPRAPQGAGGDQLTLHRSLPTQAVDKGT